MRPVTGASSRPERRSERRRDPREENMTSVRALRGAVASAVFLILSLAMAAADNWPSRPITTISTVSAGNAGDTVARIVLDQVSKQIGQGFVLENRPGGGGTLGTAAVAKAEPDGYTVLLLTSSQGSYVVLHKTLAYDPFRDFAPVALFGVQPSVLVAAPSKGWKSAADLVAAAKAKPGVLNFASAGLGSASHWAAERFRLATGINVQHIPFRGPVEAFTEVMTGRVDYYYLPITPALPNIREGKIVALAVSTPQRAPALPEVQTVAEAGYPDAEYLFWGGLAFPAKTPRGIVERLHAETNKALAVPAVRERLIQLGVLPRTMGVDEFTTFFHNEIKSTVKLAKDINFVPTN
jgi:tripartite-type tricarboxylate transporter receptor subunit TctC